MSVSGVIDRQHMSARERHMLDIAISVRGRIAGDCDVSGYAYEVSNAVSDLLAACNIRKVKYTRLKLCCLMRRAAGTYSPQGKPHTNPYCQKIQSKARQREGCQDK